MGRVVVVVLAGVAVVLAVVLAAVVVLRVVPGTDTTTVTGVIGSEKAAFFADPEVEERFAELGYQVEVRSRGSRAIATVDLSGDDFGFPGSDPSAEHFQQVNGVDREYQPFYSPMVVLSYEPMVDALAEAGVTSRAEDGTWDLDMAAYLELAADRTRWRDLPGDAVADANRGEILVRTTDPRTSNSAAMYLAVTSYLLNDEEVVQDAEADTELVEEAARLFLAQGNPPDSSQQPFDQFVALGPGHTPLLWCYESQYVSAQVQHVGLPEDVVVLYPGPSTVSTHTLLPLTDAGAEVGRLLTEDPELQRLAAAHGFRTSDPARFAQVAEEHELPVRGQVGDVVNAPTYEVMEGLITQIEDRYDASGMPEPADDSRAAPGTDQE